jgi:quercetin dioxygenase-like cupin family protein
MITPHPNEKPKMHVRTYMDFEKISDRFTFSLGLVHYARAQCPIREHIHPDCIEIVFLIKGEQFYTVSGKEYLVRGGDIFIAFPNEFHSTGHHPEDKSELYYFIINPYKFQQSLLGFDERESQSISQRLLYIDKRVFKGSAPIFMLLDNLALAYKRSDAIKKTVIQNTVLSLLIEIIRCAENGHASKSLPVQPAIDFITTHIGEEITLEKLAENGGCHVELRFAWKKGREITRSLPFSFSPVRQWFQ